ncbi:methyltransferase [Candidatus Woesearchaeota archaeon]|nr:methyltransferase [Candidatus Woesearchaeota archaeon]
MFIRTKGQLAVLLSKLKGFHAPKAALEQYDIPSEIAATLLWDMLLRGDIDGKAIIDLGAGTGILGLGAAVLGARRATLVEIDKDVIAVAKENSALLEAELDAPLPVMFVHSPIESYSDEADVVIQNPPFGVQKEHADRLFLEKAFTLAPVVYSVHKAESENFLASFAEDHGYRLTHRWFFSWPLKATMRFHSQRKHLVKVGAWRFSSTI